jgi:hypothetical protein
MEGLNLAAAQSVVEGLSMFTDFVGGFLGALGGLAIGVVALRYLAGQLIELQISRALAEHQHGLDKQLTTVQAHLSRFSDVLSRRNEREFSVTEKAWELMIEAFGAAQGHFGQGREVPVFKLMDETHALKIINRLPFDEDEKVALREAGQDERDEKYERFELARGYSKSYERASYFKNYVSSHEILFAQATYEKFIEIRNDLFSVVIDVGMYVGHDPEDFTTTEKVRIGRDLRALDEKVKALAVVIRERFGFSEE